MVRIRRLVLGLIIFLVAFGCGNSSNSKRAERLKKGEELFTKYGCTVCHSLDGKVIYGPALNEIYLTKTKVVRQGQEIMVVADRDYLIKAIGDPGFEKVSDYKNKDMPKTFFPEEDVEMLADFIIEINKKNSDN